MNSLYSKTTLFILFCFLSFSIQAAMLKIHPFPNDTVQADIYLIQFAFHLSVTHPEPHMSIIYQSIMEKTFKKIQNETLKKNNAVNIKHTGGN